MNADILRTFLERTPLELEKLRDALADADFSLARSLANLLRERGIEIDAHSFWYTAFGLERACRKELLEEAQLYERRLTREFHAVKSGLEHLEVYRATAADDNSAPEQPRFPSQQELAVLVRLNADRFRRCIDELAEGNPGQDVILRARRTLSALNGIITFLGLHTLKSVGADAEKLLDELKPASASSNSELWSVFSDLADLQSRTISHLTETGENAEALAIALETASSALALSGPTSRSEPYGHDSNQEVD